MKAGYFAHARPEMVPFVPAAAVRILEVGCGAGAFGALVKETRPCEYWGVEPDAAACAEARTRLDRVIEGRFLPRALDGETFDCIVFNDVLEHLPDPEETLRGCRALLRPAGRVVASLPNLRFFPYLYRLVVRGELEYEDEGVLDRTHLRLFTGRSAARMFARQGYEVVTLSGIPGFLRRRERWLVRLLGALSLGRLADLGYLQFAVVAEPRAAQPPGVQ